MTTSTSRLTSKYQATIPADVRRHLELRAGDRVAFEIREDGVILSKVRPLDQEYLSAAEETLSEWASQEDDEAYADL
ncbi:AbrB/MazE/SpoVT family DNA-binding domain-containing protein [Seongchinamella unica]|uniref:AbrB/MazE/SpoVT family DNA-binding domain-containing protein n=1 Tax=Seongchinamella unica TaxID=2547392 RepID=A0A4R5LN46_9GAMM|nr:AbrB/MazE/SpoVT family DNA-binding domain-containing protein [Seongchinamella unica]TDG11631.1 AbrB/MazE/SpoVT family DNA-binding domain-containing protein [Seongchinamella unica]